MLEFLHFCRVFENSIYFLFGTSAMHLAWSVVEYEGDLILLGGCIVNVSTSNRTGGGRNMSGRKRIDA